MNSIDVVGMIAAGISDDDIAERQGLTVDRVHELLVETINRASEMAPHAVGIQIQQLDLLRRSFTPAALRGDASAARILLAIAQLRARLQTPRSSLTSLTHLERLNQVWKDPNA